MSQCQFKTITGKTCQEEAGDSGLCYWHDDRRIKLDEDLKERLQQRAQSGIPMGYFKLRNTDLSHINLVNRKHHSGYELVHADLYRSDLRDAHLFGIDLSFSSLMKANLTGANLHSANLEHTNLLGIKLKNAKLEGVQWGDMLRQEWQANHETDLKKQKQLYSEAEEIYRAIAREMRNQGMTQEISWFLYRELLTRRKQLPKYSFARMISKFVDLYCGYGEKPLRLILVSALLILSFALLHGFSGTLQDGKIVQLSLQYTLWENLEIFVSSLYFSIVTFTTLGYGDISPIGISRFIAAVEAFTGSFTIALFVVVFVKRMTR